MTDTTHVNREEVRRRLDRLRGDYDEVPVVEQTEETDSALFDELRELSEAGYTGGGYGWVIREPAQAPPLSESMPDDHTEDRPQVLLIQGRGDDHSLWGLPGGGREGGETYEATALREIREETGIEATIDAPYLAYRVRTRPEDDREVCLHTLWLFFDAAYDDGHIDVQPTELRGAAWFVQPPRGLQSSAQYRAADWWDDYEMEADLPAPYDPA
jgi:8-oxo-dGTP diphosphatase